RDICISAPSLLRVILFFILSNQATSEIYSLSLHDALPICDLFATFNFLLSSSKINVRFSSVGSFKFIKCPFLYIPSYDIHFLYHYTYDKIKAFEIQELHFLKR